MSDKISTLQSFDPAQALQRGFGHIDYNGDGKISQGDELIVPFKENEGAELEMVTVKYDKTHGPLLEHFLVADPSEYGENFVKIANGPGQATAEWETGDEGKFAYFTKLEFHGDKDSILAQVRKTLASSQK